MANTIGTFHFFIRGNNPAPDEISVGTTVNIYVKRSIKLGRDGPPVISPDLVSIEEIDNHIDALIADLQVVRVAAKVAFHGE